MRYSKESQVEGFEAVAPYKRTLKVLLSPRTHQTKNLSLGMTIPDPGWSGSPHSYEIEEEIWFVLSGTGLARVADDTINIEKDTSIYIPPGQAHQLVNNGSEQMRVLWVILRPLRSKRVIWERKAVDLLLTVDHQLNASNGLTSGYITF